MLKTQETQILEELKESVEYPLLATVNGIKIVKYTEKSVAAIGETKSFKDAIKEVGGKWNSKLKCGPGWILSAKKLEALKASLSSTDPSPSLGRKVVRRKKVKVAALTLVKNEVVKVLPLEPSVCQLTRIETKLDNILSYILGTMGLPEAVNQPPHVPPHVPPKPVDVVEQVVKKTRKKIVKRRKKIKKSDQVPHPTTIETAEHVDQKPSKKLLGK